MCAGGDGGETEILTFSGKAACLAHDAHRSSSSPRNLQRKCLVSRSQPMILRISRHKAKAGVNSLADYRPIGGAGLGDPPRTSLPNKKTLDESKPLPGKIKRCSEDRELPVARRFTAFFTPSFASVVFRNFRRPADGSPVAEGRPNIGLDDQPPNLFRRW